MSDRLNKDEAGCKREAAASRKWGWNSELCPPPAPAYIELAGDSEARLSSSPSVGLLINDEERPGGNVAEEVKKLEVRRGLSFCCVDDASASWGSANGRSSSRSSSASPAAFMSYRG